MAEQSIVPPGFPTIDIDGRTLVGKMDFICKYQMGLLDLRISDCKVFFGLGEQSLAYFPIIAKMFSCLVAGNYVNKNDPGAVVSIPTPQYWMAVVDNNNDLWTRMCMFVQQSLLKVAPPTAAPASAEAGGAALTD